MKTEIETSCNKYITFSTELAETYGLCGAIVFSELESFYAESRLKNECPFVVITLDELHQKIPFFSKRKIKNAMACLEGDEFIALKNTISGPKNYYDFVITRRLE